MLISNLKNVMTQVNLNTNIKLGIDFLMNMNLAKCDPGRISIDGDNVFVRVIDCETIPFEDAKFEAHNKYIDIHYVSFEREIIWCLDRERIHQTDQYDIEKDVLHGIPKKPEDVSKLVLSRGDLAILYPSDVHAPKGLEGPSKMIRKIVIKVAI
jgi:biofilm protein TabA